MTAAMLVVVSSLGAGAAAKTATVPASPSVKPSPQCTSTHRVLANDSWSRLAARFRVPQARLLRINSASLTTPLFIGDMVCLAVRSTSSSAGGAAGTASTTTTTVVPTSTTTTTTTTTTVASTPTAPTVTVAEPVACRPIQVSWRGASPDTGLYSLQWVRVSAAGTYDFREYTMWNVRGTSTAMPNWLAHGATYALRIYAMRADWDGLTHSNQNVTPHSAIVTFTLPSCNQPATTTTTTVAPATCADGGTCVVGDTGPGGGIVFYVHSGGGTFTCGSALTSTCRYLEAAPNFWGNSSTADDACATPGTATDDPACVWSGVTGTAIGATAQGTAVGTGYANTQAAVGQAGGGNTAGRAITAAWDYSNNGKTDWHLPSQDELNELCKYSRTQTTGDTSVQCNNSGSQRTGFSGGYWGSNEVTLSNSWQQGFASGSRGQSAKTNSWKVRPVRAFGGTLGCADGGTCVVGDTGPGGGIVFYVAGANFTSTGSDCGTACRYLEAAPTDQSTGVVWATTAAACYPTGSDSGTSDCQLNSIYSNTSGQAASRTAATGIGAGMANTNQIYARLTTAGSALTSAYAAGIAWAYTNNGRSDWHLPSKDELNELCKYAKNTGQAAGGATLCSGGADAAVRGFTATNYWSSSEDSAVNAWQHSFFDGSRGANSKFSTTNYVRVVRAFG